MYYIFMAILVLYLLFVHRNFVVCRHIIFDKLGCSVHEKEFAEP
jgi:hypothetical protein